MKVGVVGCGSIGRRYVQWLHKLGCNVAVHDTDSDKLAGLAPDVEVFTDWEAYLACGVEKAVVATPPQNHVGPAVPLLERGADLLVEKPMAATLEDAEIVTQTAKRLGRSVWVVCNMRFHPGVKAIRGLLAEIGRPLSVRAYFSHRLAQMRPAGLNVYAASANEGGGVILDCIHEFDYLQWLFGPVTGIRGWCGRIGDDPIEADDVADIQMQFRNECHATMHLDFLSPLKRRGLEIIGSETTAVWLSSGRDPEVCEVVVGNNEDVRVACHVPSVNGQQPYKEMLERFLMDGDGLQTATEACASLRAALAAPTTDWARL